jgi:hypothetical protein
MIAITRLDKMMKFKELTLAWRGNIQQKGVRILDRLK